MINVNGHRFMTLADPIYINGRRVSQVWAKDKMVYPCLPNGIKVITPPTKTEYNAGEEIDYSGIVVIAINADGSTWKSIEYPEGIIPFEELIFPTKETGGEETVYYTDYSGLNYMIIQAREYTETRYDRSSPWQRNWQTFFRSTQPIGINNDWEHPEIYWGMGQVSGENDVALTHYNGNLYACLLSGNNGHDICYMSTASYGNPYYWSFPYGTTHRLTLNRFVRLFTQKGHKTPLYRDDEDYDPYGFNFELYYFDEFLVPESFISPLGCNPDGASRVQLPFKVQWERYNDKKNLETTLELKVHYDDNPQIII